MRLKLEALAASVLLTAASAQNQSLPVVDLGYSRHQAAVLNQTGDYYNFTNIRYAAPPVGDLRFRAPQAPGTDRSSVQNGLDNIRICPQGNPAWISAAIPFITEYLLSGGAWNETSLATLNATLAALEAAGNPTEATAPPMTEDCLFLDIVVPRTIFESAGQGEGRPVLVWIYGGGYTEGAKTGLNSGNPSGLIRRSQDDNDEGIIYVAINYRLGAFGWLSGPDFAAEGTPNAGLYDQRFALEWVQENIHLFGGNPNNVTVIGESAGGGSIMHQITAYGGQQPVPFQQAITQSPGFFPETSPALLNNITAEFLSLLNVTTIAEARTLSSETLMMANALQVANSGYGQFTYGPSVDGDFVPDLPGKLLAQGRFAKDLNVMNGHNGNEGLLFTSPYILTDGSFRTYLNNYFPGASMATIDYIANTLYPPVFDGSYGYTNQVGRQSLLVTEAVFTCNSYYLDMAYNNETYSYFFDVLPALHGQDVRYTFFNGPALDMYTQQPLNTTVAVALQDYITSFAEDGSPDTSVTPVPVFQMYGANAMVQQLTSMGIQMTRDPAANARCAWWQLGLYAGTGYLGANGTAGSGNGNGTVGGGSGSGNGTSGVGPTPSAFLGAASGLKTNVGFAAMAGLLAAMAAML